MRIPGSILSLFLLLLWSGSYSRAQTTDSLILLLGTAQSDTARLITLYQVSDEFEVEGNYPEGLRYGKIALRHADSALSNPVNGKTKRTLKRYKAKTFSNIGIILQEQGNYSEALKSYFSSLKIMEEIDDKKGIASALNNIGIIYDLQDNYSQALRYYEASLTIKRSIGDNKGIASAFNNIGLVHFNQKNYNKAIENYKASIKIKEELGDKKAIAYSYNNIGNVYFAMAETAGRANDISQRNLNLDLAIENYTSALHLQEQAGNKAAVASCLSNIGSFLAYQRKFKEARSYLLRAGRLAREAGHKEYLLVNYRSLSELDSAEGNFKDAYENHKMFVLYRDSLDNEETRKNSIQSQMRYDFEKKEAIAAAEHKKEMENQQALADEKSRKQRLILVFVSFGLLLVVLFAAFVFRSLSLTRKQKLIIEKQKQQVEQQKKEVEQQKLLVEEHQKEIIDSIIYARRIQNAQLPTEQYIQKSLARLNRN
ncbi:MAG TPA: tetratricopeptide repeat protein [Bacteroidia bacterium]|jgi:tetratricopeptide (TPR) repeat protein